MKIAVLSDIHANADALAQVLEAASRQEVARLLVLGDCIGYYFEPDRVFDLLEDWSCEFIKGNHEHILLDYPQMSEREKVEIRQKYGNGFDLCEQKLTPARWEQIRSMPDTKTLAIDDCTLLLCHGSPWDYNTYIYPDATPEVLDRCGREGVDFVLMGHTHYPFVSRGRHSLIANTGSVGQSRVMGGIADWAIIDLQNKSVYTATHAL